MSASPTPSEPSSLLWDIVRYVLVAAVAGVLIWYSFFYTPVTYSSQKHEGTAMGTHYQVRVDRFPDNADWEQLTAAIQDRLESLEQMMSIHRRDSEISRFNASSDTDTWFSVSPEVALVVQTALEISQLSEGAFDITVAPLVSHWGFGTESRFPRQNRTFEDLRASALYLKERIGYSKLSVQLNPPALKKAIPELTIDLSGIAKGFAVDSIAELLEERRITDYLIEIGGEVRVKGKKGVDRDSDWIVGIDNPTKDFTGFHQTFPLTDQSLATSGNHVQTITISDIRVSHLIDPRTGLPVPMGNGTRELTSVAVLAPNCTLADAWATAMFVLGEQKGIELAHRHEIAVLFLLRNGDDIIEVSSRYWRK